MEGPLTTYHRPASLAEALDLLARGPMNVAAGCTDLYPATTAAALPGDVLDITAIPALCGVSCDGGWRIGAATTWTDLIGANLPPAFDGLTLAAREVGSVQIQNAGTVAGNLCTASPAGDSIPPLMTLDAVVELQSARATRTLPLAGFLTGPRQTALQPDELVTAIRIPQAAGRGAGHFLKLGARKYLIISIAMTAARIEVTDGLITHAALSVGACGPVAPRLTRLEQALIGVAPRDAPAVVTQDLVAPHLSPIDDIRADAAYRLKAATELMRRTLLTLTQPQTEAA